MKTESVIALAYTRGLRPKVRQDRLLNRVEWVGNGMTDALGQVLRIHEDRIISLLSSGWQPPEREVPGSPAPSAMLPTVGSNPTTSQSAPEFDLRAEQVVRAVHALEAGFQWFKCGRIEILRGPRTNRRALDDLLSKVKADGMRDRVMAHLTPPPTHTGCLWVEYKVSRYPDGHPLQVHRVGTEEYIHPFDMKPLPQSEAWRFWGEANWRMLWGIFDRPAGSDRVKFRRFGRE